MMRNAKIVRGDIVWADMGSESSGLVGVVLCTKRELVAWRRGFVARAGAIEAMKHEVLCVRDVPLKTFRRMGMLHVVGSVKMESDDDLCGTFPLRFVDLGWLEVTARGDQEGEPFVDSAIPMSSAEWDARFGGMVGIEEQPCLKVRVQFRKQSFDSDAAEQVCIDVAEDEFDGPMTSANEGNIVYYLFITSDPDELWNMLRNAFDAVRGVVAVSARVQCGDVEVEVA